MPILNVFSLVLGITWRVYWYIKEKPANENKPKIKNKYIILEKISICITSLFIASQLLGFTVFPFQNQIVNIFGFLLVLAGFAECMIARYNLSDNWANSYEYQIKKKHELITSGIYAFVRHPIYGGMWLMGTGMLMVSGSNSVILFIPLVLVAINHLARREEKLLTKHFGKKYLTYQKSSKKFIPFIY